MTLAPDKKDVLRQLQHDILRMQGNGAAPPDRLLPTGLGPAEAAFPSGRFPLGVIHEFISSEPAAAAATSGFITGLLRAFDRSAGPCIWVSTGRTVFPPALKAFGIAPERLLFVDVVRAVEALWAVEEALKCEAVSAVVCEIGDLSFTESRRLQLAVEEKGVTGFIHRCRPKTAAITAAVARWQIAPIPTSPEAGLPGLGHPRWAVQLLRVRNGRPGSWQLEWGPEGFRHLPLFTAQPGGQRLQATG